MRSYIIGVDPAGGGVEGDYACAQVVDRDSGLQCAELHAHLTPRELAAQVTALAREYNDALVVVERNNQGGEVLSCLRNVNDYFNLFEDRGQAGFYTSWSSRSRLIAAIGNAFTADSEKFSSTVLLREMRTFVRRKDGSAAAGSGAYDDAVMAMGLALYVRETLAGTPPRAVKISENRNF